MRFARCTMIAGALAVFALAPAVAQQPASTTGRSIKTLARVPLKSRDGAPILLGSRIAKRKPTLIATWASWCMPCYAEAPYLNRLRQELGGSFNFIYVNRRLGDPDPDQPAQDISRFLKRGGMSDVDYVVADLPAYRQIMGADIQSVPPGKVGIPRLYLFDAKGRQIYSTLGFSPMEFAKVEQRLRQAIAAQ